MLWRTCLMHHGLKRQDIEFERNTWPFLEKFNQDVHYWKGPHTFASLFARNEAHTGLVFIPEDRNKNEVEGSADLPDAILQTIQSPGELNARWQAYNETVQLITDTRGSTAFRKKKEI